MAKTKTKTRKVSVKAKRSRGKRGFTLPLAAVGGFLPLGSDLVSAVRTGGMHSLQNDLIADLTGYNKRDDRWSWRYMQSGTIPIVTGMLIHKFVGGKLGVNRALGQAGVPFIRL